jgi:hypothetical protein
MNIFKEHVEYLKDNPEGYWFKRKLYGWGWTPAKWQGWAFLFGYVAIVLTLAFRVNEQTTGEALIEELFIPVVVLTILLIILSYLKGEKPRWQWGLPDRDTREGE